MTVTTLLPHTSATYAHKATIVPTEPSGPLSTRAHLVHTVLTLSWKERPSVLAVILESTVQQQDRRIIQVEIAVA